MDFLEKTFGRLGNRMFQLAYIYSQFRDAKTPDIFLQNPKYFEKYSDEIRQLFGDGITQEDKIAVHFRRGDYVNNPFYVDLTKTDYYQKAMAMFPDEKFLLFSDDNQWLNKNWQGDYEFAIGNEVDDLKRFASCKGAIIANSSWSWWGAFLGDKDKKVIAPNNWYGDNIERTLCPKNWIKI